MDGDIGEDEQVDVGTIAPLPSAGTHRGTHDSPFSVSSGEAGPSSYVTAPHPDVAVPSADVD